MYILYILLVEMTSNSITEHEERKAFEHLSLTSLPACLPFTTDDTLGEILILWKSTGALPLISSRARISYLVCNQFHYFVGVACPSPDFAHI